MTTAIIITTYNRPTETKRCFDSIRRANIIPGTYFIIVDDKSTDQATINLIGSFHIDGCKTVVLINPKNSRISYSLKVGYEMAFALGCDIVMNLDNDCLVRNDFQTQLIKLKKIWPDNIVTGFNCLTRNRDGSERHKVVGGGIGYNFKQSVGGINMVLHKEQFTKYMLPALDKVIASQGNWDHLTCINSMADHKEIVCLKPSVIQHQATQSSMGHNEPPDIADDFIGLLLPDVTLCIIDDNIERCAYPVEQSCKNIKFGAVVRLHSENIKSKEGYSLFIMNKLFEFVTTTHVLIIQHDGWIVNWESWQKEWLQYDYIGAPWPTEYEYRVGNGGFSLRSQKLCRLTAGLNWPVTHPEDAVICRELRPKLENEYGVKFAPLEVAEQFSYEGFNQPNARFTTQFGFHNNVLADVLKSNRFIGVFPGVVRRDTSIIDKLLAPKKEGLIFNQFLGLGDILFLVPLARHYISLGHDIIWPVADEYQPDLKRHFPDIQFVFKSRFDINYDRRDIHMHRWQYGTYKVLPFRWNKHLQADASDCMTSKYTMVGVDWKMWRGLRWERDYIKECNLCERMRLLMIFSHLDGENNPIYNSVVRKKDEFDVSLGVGDYARFEYELHCNTFGCLVTDGKQERQVGDSGLPVVNMKPIDGFSMLDWSLIIENATIIHAVSSSTLYMFEVLNLKAKEIHLYGRTKEMKDHDFVRPIRTKNYILHP